MTSVRPTIPDQPARPALAKAETEGAADLRALGRLIAQLVRSGDDKLERFLGRHLAGTATTVEQLRHGRDVLRAVAEIVRAGRPEGWERLPAVLALLRAAPAPAAETSVTADAAGELGVRGPAERPIGAETAGSSAAVPPLRPPSLADPPPPVADGESALLPPRPCSPWAEVAAAAFRPPPPSRASRTTPPPPPPIYAPLPPPPPLVAPRLALEVPSEPTPAPRHGAPALPFEPAPARPAALPSEPGAAVLPADQTGPVPARASNTEPPAPAPADAPLPFGAPSRPSLRAIDTPPASPVPAPAEGGPERTVALAALEADALWELTGDDDVTLAARSAYELSVEEYAALCVRCARPAEREAAHLAVGLRDEEARAQLHRRWKQRFDADPTLHARWRRLCAELRVAGR